MSQQPGLLMLFTGNGKGKTTAALGQALRACGHGQRVCFIQFVKARQDTGEARAATRLADCLEFHVTGSGFSWQDQEAFRRHGLAGWQLAREKMASDGYQLLVLDEFTYLLSHGVLAEQEVIAALNGRPTRLNLIITGRGASSTLITAADLVTEMREIKHPFRRGVQARAGIEY